MDGGVHQNLAVPGLVPLLGESDLVPAVPAGVGGEIPGGAEVDPAHGQVGGDPRLQNGPGDGGGVHIHVGNGGDAVGDHLSQTQAGAGGHGPVVQLGFRGEDPLVQPGLEVAPAAVAPEEGHGDVGVGVDQTRHEDVAVAVHLLVKGAVGADRAHGGDLVPLHGHEGVV